MELIALEIGNIGLTPSSGVTITETQDEIYPFIHRVLVNGMKGYVEKTIRPYPIAEPLCYSPKDLAQNEIEISILAGMKGVGPVVYDFSLEKGSFVMEQYDGTLGNILEKYPNIDMDLENVKSILPVLLERLQNAGIAHRDLHPENIFYKKDGIFVIGDYGSAIRTTDSRYLKRDGVYIESIIRIINGTLDRSLFTPYLMGSFYERVSAPSEMLPAEIIWKGNICSDWI